MTQPTPTGCGKDRHTPSNSRCPWIAVESKGHAHSTISPFSAELEMGKPEYACHETKHGDRAFAVTLSTGLATSMVQARCWLLAPVLLRYHSDVDRDPHQSGTRAIPEQYRSKERVVRKPSCRAVGRQVSKLDCTAAGNHKLPNFNNLETFTGF